MALKKIPTEVSVLSEVRLTAFKSFRGATLPLSPLTLLIGRNGSGKSNAIDALEVLVRLSQGEDVRDALDGGGRDEGPPVRGGAQGCAPTGSSTFSLGCTVKTGHQTVTLDVTVQVEPVVQILDERITRTDGRVARLLETAEADPERADVRAQYHNGKRGPDPSVTFRASRLLTSQVAARVPDRTPSEAKVHRAAEQLLAALGGIFVLDPVPHLMRQYVQERDVSLRRRGENLSAALGHLREDPATWEQLIALLASLPEQQVQGLSVERSSLGDVMIAIQERIDDRVQLFPARLMSDGMLRFLAIAAALLEAPRQGSPTSEASASSVTTLVVEEIENGLHPSRVAQVLDLLAEQASSRRIRTLATTHSPALLSALSGDAHRGVVVCDREPGSGTSRLRPLVDLPSYPRALAAGSLGDAVTRERLSNEERPSLDALDFLLQDA